MKRTKTTGKKKKALSPREATTTEKLRSLKRDNIATPHFWILLSEDSVTIAEQRKGENCKQVLKISRSVFNKFIDWYNTPQE